MSRAILSIVPLVLAALACGMGDPLVDMMLDEQVSTSEAFGESVQATEDALERLKAQATLDAAMPEGESDAAPEADTAPEPVEVMGCATDAECSNAGTHVYSMSVLETASCSGGGGGQFLQQFEFEIDFFPAIVSINDRGGDYLEEFQHESENTYVGANSEGSTQRVTFTTEGFLVETETADAKCLVYTRAD